jgi:hypothetical protein
MLHLVLDIRDMKAAARRQPWYTLGWISEIGKLLPEDSYGTLWVGYQRWESCCQKLTMMYIVLENIDKKAAAGI